MATYPTHGVSNYDTLLRPYIDEALWTNVKSPSFGATGNGTTDDRAAVHAARDAAGAGGSVYFPPGTYRVSSETQANVAKQRWILAPGAVIAPDSTAHGIRVSASNVQIVGPGKILIHASANGLCGVFVDAGMNDVTISGVEITGGSTGCYGVRVKGATGTLCSRIQVLGCLVHDLPAGNGVLFNAETSDSKIDGNTIYNVGWGVGIIGRTTGAGTSDRNIVSHNTITGVTNGENIGISQYSPDTVVTSNVCQSAAASANTIGISINFSDRTKVIGNTVVQPGLYGLESASSNQTVFSGNTVINSGDAGAIANGTGDEVSFQNNTIISPKNTGISLGSSKRARAIGNYIYDPGNGTASIQGISASYNTATAGLIISDNSIRYATAVGSGIVPDNPSATVTGNSISYDSTITTGAGTSNGISISDAANNSVVTGNNVQGNGKLGTGIAIPAATTGVLIASNKLDGTTANAIQCLSTAATNLFIGNIATTTSGSSFSINAAAKQIGNFDTAAGQYVLSGNLKIGASASDPISFYGANTTTRPTRPGQLTNSSGGTAGATVTAPGAAYSQTDEANFRASITAKYNTLEAALVTLGLIG